MIDAKMFEDMAKKICDKLPKGLTDAKEDMEKTVKSILQTTFSKLDLVTREEFDVQVKLLKKLRQRVDELEQQLQAFTDAAKK